MYYIRQKNDILVVAMQKISLATIFIREVNNFILISDFKYELNQISLSYKKITIRFCCFCSTATVLSLNRRPSSRTAKLFPTGPFLGPLRKPSRPKASFSDKMAMHLRKGEWILWSYK